MTKLCEYSRSVAWCDFQLKLINMLIGVAICTLDSMHLAGPNSVHHQGAHHVQYCTNICIGTKLGTR